MEQRITKYGQLNSCGGHSLGLRVNGVQILLSPSADQQDDADALAALISRLGPESIAPPTQAPIRQAPKAPTLKPTSPFKVGEAVWCNVHGAQGWHTITDVGSGRNYGRIKVTGVRFWCPSVNFNREAK